MSDAELLARLRALAARERSATADFVACLAEADRRPNAVLREGYSDLFDFCRRDLKLAESTAYQRVNAARLTRARPEILSLLADGSIHLSNLCLIAPWLVKRPSLLGEIAGKSKREVEALVAALGVPRSIPDRIRPVAGDLAVPDDSAAALPLSPGSDRRAAEAQSAVPEAARGPAAAVDAKMTAAEAIFEPRTEFRFAARPRFVRVVERLRSLLWHKYPSGRLEDLLYEAANDFVLRRDPAREPKRPGSRQAAAASPPTRRIRAELRRAVWRRDGGRCAYSGRAGRCAETRGLEIDHVMPWALGGRSDQAANLRLLCRAHNQSEAERFFPRESTRVDSGDNSA